VKNFRIKQTFWGIGIFIILNSIAMLFYPGGTIIDKETEGHLFFYNFLSNLGEKTARNGEENITSAIFFNSSLVLVSISFLLFYTKYFQLFKGNLRSYYTILSALFFLSVSIFSFISVAIFTADKPNFDLHVFFVKLAFRSLLLFAILQSLATYLNQDMTKKVFVASLLFTCAIFLFILMMDYGPNPFENNNALFIQVTAQKFIAFCILLNTYFQANESLKYT